MSRKKNIKFTQLTETQKMNNTTTATTKTKSKRIPASEILELVKREYEIGKELNDLIFDMDGIKFLRDSESLEQMSSRADAVVRKSVSDMTFNESQKPSQEAESDYSDYNPTAMGNIAYLALHAPTKEYRKAWLDLLKRVVAQEKIDLKFTL